MNAYTGEKIKKLRENRGLSQRSLAEKLEISNQHLSNIEKGRRFPRMEVLRKISRIFDVDYNDLLDFDAQIIQKVYASPLVLDDKKDRNLAESLYSNNPYTLEQAISQKQASLDRAGIKIDIRKFLEKSPEKQVLLLVKMLKNNNFSLLFLTRELMIQYVSRALGEGNQSQLETAIKAFDTFFANCPKKESQEKKHLQILASFRALYELCCKANAIISNRRLLEKHMSKTCLTITSPHEKTQLSREYREKKEKRPRSISLAQMRKAG